MGKKKDRKEKKQTGSQKTALKTEKKHEKKTKKMLQERGEVWHCSIHLVIYLSTNPCHHRHSQHPSLFHPRLKTAATDKLMAQIVKRDSWPIQPDILNPSLLRQTSKKPLWLDLQPVDIKSRWRHNWKSAQVVNSHLVCDPTIRQPGFDLPRQQ